MVFKSMVFKSMVFKSTVSKSTAFKSMVFVFAALLLAPSHSAAQEADDKPLREVSRGFVAAWNRADAAGVAKLYAPDAVLTMPDGRTIRGRDAIRDACAADFTANPGGRMTFSAEEFRWLGADAAVWRCEWKATGGKQPAAGGTGLAVLARSKDGWQIAEDLAALTPAAPKAKAGHGHSHGPAGHSHDHGEGSHTHGH